jgi:hypothetical protein
MTAAACEPAAAPATTRRFEILDLAFRVTGLESEAAASIDAFMAQYTDVEPFGGPRPEFLVQVRRGDLPACENGVRIPVHRHKREAYWCFDGVALGGERRAVVWPTKGAAVALSVENAEAELLLDFAVPEPVAGELAFHLCRGLSLYLRRPERGALVHAAAVEVGGRVVAFCGNAFAGKTTLLIESVLQHGARPLANDRTLLTYASPARAVSWPSYFTCTEGTILRYPELTAAAEAYEREQAPPAVRWPRPLEPVFDGERKRMYPMQWFTTATRRPYVSAGELGALVFSRIEPSVPAATLRELDAGDADAARVIRGHLASVVFNGAESSFLPWHRLAAPHDEHAVDRLLEVLAASDCRVLRLELPPDRLDVLSLLFRQVSSR